MTRDLFDGVDMYQIGANGWLDLPVQESDPVKLFKERVSLDLSDAFGSTPQSLAGISVE